MYHKYVGLVNKKSSEYYFVNAANQNNNAL